VITKKPTEKCRFWGVYPPETGNHHGKWEKAPGEVKKLKKKLYLIAVEKTSAATKPVLKKQQKPGGRNKEKKGGIQTKW